MDDSIEDEVNDEKNEHISIKLKQRPKIKRRNIHRKTLINIEISSKMLGKRPNSTKKRVSLIPVAPVLEDTAETYLFKIKVLENETAELKHRIETIRLSHKEDK